MLPCWSISETSHKWQVLLMLVVLSGKECPVFEMDGKAFVAACPRGCGVTHRGFCVWNCSLFCLGSSALSLVAPGQFLPASPFCQASWVHNCYPTYKLLTQ